MKVKQIIHVFSMVLLSVVLTEQTITNKKINIYLIGDSTMCLYDESRFSQEGWGMPFAHFLMRLLKLKTMPKEVRVQNLF